MYAESPHYQCEMSGTACPIYISALSPHLVISYRNVQLPRTASKVATHPNNPKTRKQIFAINIGSALSLHSGAQVTQAIEHAIAISPIPTNVAGKPSVGGKLQNIAYQD